MESPATADGGVVVSQLTKSFGGVRAIDDVNLALAPGEFMALLGPSGCGKTSLLRAIAGLIAPDRGSIRFGGRTVADPAARILVPAERRGIGMVFQDYALWPHLRVRENVAFPLQARRVPKPARPALIEAALRRVGLADLAERYPAELSGGQQQRVALARATVDTPSILLFDEPLSNLDSGLRDALGREIAALVRSLGATALYVTHDQTEALSLADRIAIMRDGRVVQVGAPQALYADPADIWVARFLKSGSLVQGHAADGTFRAAGGSAPIALPELVNGFSGPSTLLLPFGALRVGDGPADLRLSVTDVHFRGDRYEIAARWGEAETAPVVQLWHDRAPRPGERLPAVIERSRLRLYKEEHQ